MENELGYDVSRWKDPKAGMHFAEGMHMDDGFMCEEGTTQVLADMHRSGVLTSLQLEWMHRNHPPQFQKPMRILAWLRRRLDLPMKGRTTERGQIVTLYEVTAHDKEVIHTAFYYLRRGYVAKKINRENDRYSGMSGED